MKKRTLRERISYWIDCMMSKGPIAMCVLLFAITFAIVIVIGVIASFASDEGGILYQVWLSLMQTLDAGNLSGVATDNIAYLVLMFLATLCGLFLTSVLIGVIATGVEDKLSELRKGTSVVQEDNHTIIIGFDNNVYAILQELIEANSNKKNACIVILGEQPKEEIEDAISSHIPDTVTTRIICRSGNLHEAYALERCSVETCKSVIVNVHDDAETVKVLLALATYIKNKELTNPNLRFIVSLQDNQYVEAANIAGEGRAAIVYAKDAIARIISNTCRQHGLSQVLTELFNFTGNELYFEKVSELAGKSFKEATMSFSNAIVVGLQTAGQVKLNPPMDTVIGKDDEIVLLELDDGAYKYHPVKMVDESKICNDASVSATANDHLIVLGSNEKLSTILAEYDKYVETGTHVVIVDDDLDETKLDTYDNLDITVCTKPVTRELLCEFINKDANNILLLNDDSQDPETSDSQTLLRLILLRDIADNAGLDFSITTEMRSVDNQRLASQARVDDFVIGSNFASLIMAQISENPKMLPLIDDLLDESGSEMYMKPVANYVPLGVPVDSYMLTESVARKGEIYLGYRQNDNTKSDVIVNPQKDETIVFGEHDQIVVIAEN
ncbi:MAG: hypothetical protein IJN62_02070 [Clostridia bacterium]|nr:hypothetical protein [Clostridia bacterium]